MILDDNALVPLKWVAGGLVVLGGMVYGDIKRSIRKVEKDVSVHSQASAKAHLYLKLICDKLQIPYDT